MRHIDSDMGAQCLVERNNPFNYCLFIRVGPRFVDFKKFKNWSVNFYRIDWFTNPKQVNYTRSDLCISPTINIGVDSFSKLK